MNTCGATLVTYNCKSIKRSIDGIKQLCCFADIIALQETWLLPGDLSFLESVHDDFAGSGTSAVDTSAGMLRGRPFGGVALLWRKSVFQCVTIIPCGNPRIAAIRVTTKDRPVLIVCVYMPTDSVENMPEFTDCLSSISAIIDESGIESVFILGDFNAHPGERFYHELVAFSKEQDWTCVDTSNLQLTSGTFTFISEAHGCKRWLDHCLATDAALTSVTNVYVKYDVFWSDHLPLVLTCDFNVIRQKTNVKYPLRNKIQWGVRSVEQCRTYENMCNQQLKHIDLPVELQNCCGRYCRDSSHVIIIDKLYGDIVDILCKNASYTYVYKSFKCKKPLSGWNRFVSDAHKNAKIKFNTWMWYGRPSCGPLFEAMVESRKIFKGKLKWCQNNQDQIRMDLLAKRHSNSDFGGFWKSTKQFNSRPAVLVSVNNVSV